MSRRLGLAVESVADTCEGCGRTLDSFGWHRCTCMRTGRVQTRHKPLVAVWQRVFREAGIPIPDRNRERVMASTHINRGPTDMRRMDLITPGIDGVFQGSPLFMDVTIVSPIRGNGRSMPHSYRTNGAALSRADDRNRNRDYPDVERSSTAQLLCLGVETYGRWGDHSITLVRQLARYRSRNSPDYVRASVEQCSNNRWWGLLSVAVQCIVAEGILRLQGADLHAAGDSVEQLILEDLLHMHP